jgi:hypothetical protein
MLAKMTYGAALAALICLADVGVATSATGIPAELARKCSVLANRAYPLRVSHNPASGRIHGSAQAVRHYFNRCVASGGEMKGHGQRHESQDR